MFIQTEDTPNPSTFQLYALNYVCSEGDLATHTYKLLHTPVTRNLSADSVASIDPSLLHCLNALREDNTSDRTKKIYDKIGYKKFYKKLISSDPLCKNKILASDTQRVLRAFEVKRFTKKSIYEWAKNTKSDFKEYDVRKIYLNIPREKLLIKLSLIHI